jgi:hypothetical protein
MKELKSQQSHNNNYGESIYSKVGNEKRLALLNMVKTQGKSLKDAACLLKINYSTAKTILRVYRVENRILKKTPHQKRNKKVFLVGKSPSEETSSIDLENENHNKSSLLHSSNISPSLTVYSPQPLHNCQTKLPVTHFKNHSSYKLTSNINSPIESKKTSMSELSYQYQCLVNNLKFCVNDLVNNEIIIKNLCSTLHGLKYPNFIEKFKNSLSTNDMIKNKLRDNLLKQMQNIGINNFINTCQSNDISNFTVQSKSSGNIINSESSSYNINQANNMINRELNLNADEKQMGIQDVEFSPSLSISYVHRPIPVNIKDIVNA